MRILSLDTATTSCSVAVTAKNTVLAESTVTAGKSHAQRVMVMIRNVLDMAGLTVAALDGFAVSRGPGSFTGLRIGISTIKGLAAASGKPMMGISGLDALAAQASTGVQLICPLMDARKNEVYHSLYGFEKGVLKKLTGERVLPPGKAIEGIRRPCMFIGPGAILYQEMIAKTLGDSAHFSPQSHAVIRASTLAHLAGERLARGDVDDVGRFVPIYIRKSDAELNFKRIQAGTGRQVPHRST